MHYYYVCTIPPGFVDDPPSEARTSLLWAKKKDERTRPLTGVQWSDESGLRMTKASNTKCRKCAQARPEVSEHMPQELKEMADEMNGCSSRPKRAHHCRICNRCILKVSPRRSRDYQPMVDSHIPQSMTIIAQ